MNLIQAIENIGWASMGELSRATNRDATNIRTDIKNLLADGTIVKIGDRRSTKYAVAGTKEPESKKQKEKLEVQVRAKAKAEARAKAAKAKAEAEAKVRAETQAKLPVKLPEITDITKLIHYGIDNLPTDKKYAILDLAQAIVECHPKHSFSSLSVSQKILDLWKKNMLPRLQCSEEYDDGRRFYYWISETE